MNNESKTNTEKSNYRVATKKERNEIIRPFLEDFAKTDWYTEIDVVDRILENVFNENHNLTLAGYSIKDIMDDIAAEDFFDEYKEYMEINMLKHLTNDRKEVIKEIIDDVVKDILE